MLFFHFLIWLKFTALGAIYGRMDGGGIADVKEWVERSLIMFAFVLSCAPFAGVVSVGAYLGVVGIATGHGQYFLETTIKAMSAERFDFVVRLFFGADPRTAVELKPWRGEKWNNAPQEIKDSLFLKMQDYGLSKLYWRNIFGMCVTGSLVGLPAFILAILYGQAVGVLFLLTGPIKAFSYMFAWNFYKTTVTAEYINGGLRNNLCLCIIYLMLGIFTKGFL